MKCDTPWRGGNFFRPMRPPMPVVGVHSETGERRHWRSQSEAAGYIGVSQPAVCQAIRQRRRVRGWLITYQKEETL